MPNREDLAWFKLTFGDEIAPALQGTPFGLDLITALAAQETGDVWRILRRTLQREEILGLCVGDTLDEDRGRTAFPLTKAQLVAAPQGQAMFDLAHQVLVDLGNYVTAFAPIAKKPDKFCHAYGIFQVDLQFSRRIRNSSYRGAGLTLRPA